ncbi:MAG: serpin family protein [Clostridia bacterium]|nr:serpin family protein [Clostridia bacterium]
MKRILCCLLLVCILLAGCAAGQGGTSVTSEDIGATDLLKPIKKEDPIVTGMIRPYESLMTTLGLRMFQETLKADPDGENKLISPLSILYAMAMVSNGADDQEAVKAYWGYDLLHINEYMYEYALKLPQGEKYKLQLANSIWFTEHERFTVNREFLQKVKNFYDADAYQAPFNEATCKDINEWVELKTDGMIKDILDQIPYDAVMYLVNALAFEAEWLSTYEEVQVREGVFTKADGTEQKVDFMYDSVSHYFEDENATGFMRYYSGMKYAFVAMLPNEGVTPEEYIVSLDGNDLHTMLKNPQMTSVVTSIPVFEAEYDADLRSILGAAGYPVDGTFNGVGTSTAGDIEIGRILHKTYIQVGPQGTKAGAATVVEMKEECEVKTPQEPKVVHLDRPFVYMIIDCENAVPLFIGVQNNVGK